MGYAPDEMSSSLITFVRENNAVHEGDPIAGQGGRIGDMKNEEHDDLKMM